MLEELAQKALKDSYLKKLVGKLEKIITTSNILRLPVTEKISKQEYSHLIRFSDLLSSSKEEDCRNLAYKIISLLFECDQNFPAFGEYARAVLIKLGNFPAISFLERKGFLKEYVLPAENKYEEIVKRLIQNVPNSEHTFTDSQYEIFEALKRYKHFSFSGPTSLGKSFIIESFIKYLIIDEKIRDNIAILVPTRALINQTLLKLKENLSDVSDYEILAHPKIPQYIKNRNNKYIFVFTPERLITYISEKGNPSIEYLFVDEAHKIISEKDTRGPLYYHAILQAQKRSIRLYFASPNISNPEVYLKIFDRSTDESTYTTESPVSQNKYFLNLETQRVKIIGEFASQLIELPVKKDLFEWISDLSNNDNKSIIYCNSKGKTREYAINFSKLLPYKQNKRIDDLVELIQETIHKDYYLVDCLKKGVGFHYSDLPQRIRAQLENLFRSGDIDYLFCTSTLLEGVNLPAKNIFVLSDKIGLSNFKKVDFLNLIGRAGRLNKEFSGNIFIVKESGTKDWGKDRVIDSLLSKDSPPKIKSQIIDGQKKFYENVLSTLESKDLTRKNPTNYEVEILNHYSNIALIHSIDRTGSVFLNTLLRKEPESAKALENKTTTNKVPIDILKVSSSIGLEYQNGILSFDPDKLIKLSNTPKYEEILDALHFLSALYNWDIEEAGRGQIYKSAREEKHANLLKYYAVLISNWFDAKPLKYLITRSIDYQHDNRLELYDEYNKPLGTFDKSNPLHVNIAINKLLSDIENMLRFRFVKYFNNYYLLLKFAVGEERAGSNWADFLEYGSIKKELIELQNTGLSRHLATYIYENFNDLLDFDKNGNLAGVRSSDLLERIKETDTDICNEIREFYFY